MDLRKIGVQLYAAAGGGGDDATLCNVKQRKTSAVPNYLRAFHSCVSGVSFHLMRMLAFAPPRIFLPSCVVVAVVATAAKSFYYKALRQRAEHKHVGSMARVY